MSLGLADHVAGGVAYYFDCPTCKRAVDAAQLACFTARDRAWGDYLVTSRDVATDDAAWLAYHLAEIAARDAFRRRVDEVLRAGCAAHAVGALAVA